MLSRSQRLSGRQLVEVIKRGKVLHSPFFIVRVLSDAQNKLPSKLASVVPVKIGKTSAIRHLVRRRMYESVRTLMRRINPGHLIILFAKLPALKSKPSAMSIDIEPVFVKAGLLR